MMESEDESPHSTGLKNEFYLCVLKSVIFSKQIEHHASYCYIFLDFVDIL